MIKDSFLREQIKEKRKKKGRIEYLILLEAIKRNKLKRVDKRLQVIKLYLEGVTHKEIGDRLGYSRVWVCNLVNRYKNQGLTEFARHKGAGNNRALSVEEEIEILQQFEEEYQQGKLVVANTIKVAFDKKRGKDTGKCYVYSVIKRHALSMVKIDNEKRIMALAESQYKEMLGVDKPTFDKMYAILLDSFVKLHEKAGKPPKLSVLDKLVITLDYWREYKTYRNIAFDYGVGKSAVGNSIIWVESTLIKDGTFCLPSKREMQRNDNVMRVSGEQLPKLESSASA